MHFKQNKMENLDNGPSDMMIRGNLDSVLSLFGRVLEDLPGR